MSENEKMTFEIAMEMMESLNTDSDNGITNIDGYSEDIAQALYSKLCEIEDHEYEAHKLHAKIAKLEASNDLMSQDLERQDDELIKRKPKSCFNCNHGTPQEFGPPKCAFQYCTGWEPKATAKAKRGE